eukprot:TRINITY_DN54721_c0_g1_i1.p1 TRINITY_DN54721_c0_g1~~TRINITY_DN54721_c0_g1_i1.p1  ORF type:complete len:383 (+),score=94.17 TRINITY_DN54721_c0_g1_i1:160-1308(+)
MGGHLCSTDTAAPPETLRTAVAEDPHERQRRRVRGQLLTLAAAPAREKRQAAAELGTCVLELPALRGLPHVVWCCEDGSLGAVILRFLGLVQHVSNFLRAGASAVRFDLDLRCHTAYGDLSSLFPFDPEVSAEIQALLGATPVLDSLDATKQTAAAYPWGRKEFVKAAMPTYVWKSMGMNDSSWDGGCCNPWELSAARTLYARYVVVAVPVLRVLERFASSAGLAEALGVHVARWHECGVSDEPRQSRSLGSLADANLGVAEAAGKVERAARALGVVRIFLAGDDGRFLSGLREALVARGLFIAASWPCGRAAVDTAEQAFCGLEGAVDLLAMAFCLSRCRGLLSTGSCTAAWAALWSPNVDAFPWWRFRYPGAGPDPWRAF